MILVALSSCAAPLLDWDGSGVVSYNQLPFSLMTELLSYVASGCDLDDMSIS